MPTEPKWNDPTLWEGVKHSTKCGQPHITRNGLCWNCENPPTPLFYGCFDGLRGLEIAMTLEQAQSASHQGDCKDDCRHLANEAAICDQLDAIGPDKIRDGLRECGAWDEMELEDSHQNRIRAVWLAACDIVENNRD